MITALSLHHTKTESQYGNTKKCKIDAVTENISHDDDIHAHYSPSPCPRTNFFPHSRAAHGAARLHGGRCFPSLLITALSSSWDQCIIPKHTGNYMLPDTSECSLCVFFFFRFIFICAGNLVLQLLNNKAAGPWLVMFVVTSTPLPTWQTDSFQKEPTSSARLVSVREEKQITFDQRPRASMFLGK